MTEQGEKNMMRVVPKCVNAPKKDRPAKNRDNVIVVYSRTTPLVSLFGNVALQVYLKVQIMTSGLAIIACSLFFVNNTYLSWLTFLSIVGVFILLVIEMESAVKYKSRQVEKIMKRMKLFDEKRAAIMCFIFCIVHVHIIIGASMLQMVMCTWAKPIDTFIVRYDKEITLVMYIVLGVLHLLLLVALGMKVGKSEKVRDRKQKLIATWMCLFGTVWYLKSLTIMGLVPCCSGVNGKGVHVPHLMMVLGLESLSLLTVCFYFTRLIAFFPASRIITSLASISTNPPANKSDYINTISWKLVNGRWTRNGHIVLPAGVKTSKVGGSVNRVVSKRPDMASGIGEEKDASGSNRSKDPSDNSRPLEDAVVIKMGGNPSESGQSRSASDKFLPPKGNVVVEVGQNATNFDHSESVSHQLESEMQLAFERYQTEVLDPGFKDYCAEMEADNFEERMEARARRPAKMFGTNGLPTFELGVY